MQMETVERVARFFDGGALALAVKALRSYYSPHGCFTGSEFDRLAATADPMRYTPADMLAVTMLGVSVPPRAALWLLDHEDLVPGSKTAPADSSIWDSSELLAPSGPCWDWATAVRGCHRVGRTTGSKLVAVKRPGLVPIYDKHVDAALNVGPSEWAFWRRVVDHQDAPALRVLVQQARQQAEVPGYVADLRVIDVVVWMRWHGWRTHGSRHGCTCDYTGFDG